MSTSKQKRSYLSTNQSMATSKRGPGAGKGNKLGTRGPGQMSTRSNLASSSSKKSVIGGIAPSDKSSNIRVPVQVFDEAGNDVTPLPLLTLDPNQVRIQQSNVLGDSTVGTPTDLLSQISTSFMTSAFGGGPFTRSVFTQSNDTMESLQDEDHAVADTSTWAQIRQKRAEVTEIVAEADLDKIVDLTLVETETIWMLDIPTVCVAMDSEESQSIRDNNDKYALLCKSRAGNDLYAERGMNTFNEAPKLKAIQTNKIGYTDTGVTCTNWDMYDTFKAVEKEAKDKEAKGEGGTISRPNSPNEAESSKDADPLKPDVPEVAQAVSRSASVKSGSRVESRVTMSSSVGGSELFASKETGVGSFQSDVTAVDEDKIMKSDSLKKDLFIMERVINLNTYQPKQALYRGFDIVPDIDHELTNVNQIAVSDMGPNLDRLWSYFCPLTKGRNVACLAWNKSNPDLVAVGYGQFDFTNQKSGLICCWSLKNPEYPERVYTSKHGVTALDFSVANANILAAGFYDGGVAIYNVRKTDDEPILDNQKDGMGSGSGDHESESHGKHLGPVWQIQWIEKERGSGEERAEVLISISTDGRVTQWSIRKGFENYDIMRLKKLPTRMAGKAREKKGEAFISRHAGGLCFDFHPRDLIVYLAGTEEGFIHKCSCSYNEQYLETYTGHTAPVYRIRWSPFMPDIFLSCSADWSIRLWHQERVTPILTFHSSTKTVHDLCWSPRSSTVFACVNEGALEVWDLAQSTLDAVITITPTSGAKLTSVNFSKNAECILVGDNEGQVTVYELRCMPAPAQAEFQAEALNSVIKSSLASQLPSVAGDKTMSAPMDEMDD
ncbi:dynein axonemal intermediate chain 4-like isoform X2 [Littorina saxatilis]|uniref:dynein axonemal intermediate chain 4-like isoform X2 n=1 Tax=Littorina saxatilis TaxID=31220 RepID=UPI0038B45C99